MIEEINDNKQVLSGPAAYKSSAESCEWLHEFQMRLIAAAVFVLVTVW